MSHCKDIRDLILTVDFDTEAGAGERRLLKEHLRVCGDCRAFRREVQEHLGAGLKSAPRSEVPEHLWASISEKIYNTALDNKPGLLEQFSGFFKFPKFAPALASLMVMVLITSLYFHHRIAEWSKAKEQGEYLASLLTASDTAPESESALEKYFL